MKLNSRTFRYSDENGKFDVLMTLCINGVPLGGGRVSFFTNKNKSPMLIPILFHEVIIIKCIWHRFYFVHCIQIDMHSLTVASRSRQSETQ